jgi:hypothetical protein
VLQGVPYKGKIQLLDAGGGEACVYIKQITTKKKRRGMYIEVYSI